MKISIIIATYNAAKTLKECLDSIIPQLGYNCELIVVDGASTDNTVDIIKSYGDKIATYISEPDKGIYDAWNKGVKLAKGKWVMFVGADDTLQPDAIKKYIEILSQPEIKELDYICARNNYYSEDGVKIGLIGEAPSWNKMRFKMSAAHVGSLHNRRNLFGSVGAYNLKYKICADYELLLRKGADLKYLFLNDTVIANMRTGGMSFSTKAVKEAYLMRAEHKTIPSVCNNLLYYYQLLLLKTYNLRHRSK